MTWGDLLPDMFLLMVSVAGLVIYRRRHPRPRGRHEGSQRWRVGHPLRRGQHRKTVWTTEEAVQTVRAKLRPIKSIVKPRRAARPSRQPAPRTDQPAPVPAAADPKAERLADHAVRAELVRLRDLASGRHL